MRLLCSSLLLCLIGCTAVQTSTIPTGRYGRDVFITTGDIQQPYESLGAVQTTRRGVLAFGFADPAGTDIDSGFKDLVEEVRKMGGDGVINVHFHQTQYLLATKIVFAILFFIPLPSECSIAGEAVRLRRDNGGPGAPSGPPPRGGL